MSSSLGGTHAGWFAHLLNRTVDSPQTSICILFLLYKSLLDIIAFSSPSNGFDSSTELAGWPDGGPLSKLVKWDAIWFTNLAQRGYKYEQDYAFGYGYTNLLAFGQYLWPNADFNHSIHREAIFGMLVSHVSHLLGALLLYRISLMVFRNHDKCERISFIASVLHIISPAGIFICAPYTEAPFSFLKLGSYFAYASARIDHSEGKFLLRDLQVLLAGALLGTACTFRSNGLLSGTIFFIDAVEDGLAFLKYRGDFQRFRKICFTVAAGLLIAFGQAFPQVVAWRIFCTDTNPFEKRPFCFSFPPAIYTYVQRKYWDNGPFHYWRPNQIPLFILAAPMLFAMFYSTYWVYTLYKNPPMTGPSRSEDTQPLVSSPATIERTSGDGGHRSLLLPLPQIDIPLLIRFTIPQTLIAFTCLFMAHVQIITRLSSAYPMWYWWLAIQILEYVAEEDGEAEGEGNGAKALNTGWRRWLPWFYSRWTIVYGVVQAGLYAEMLPPA